MLNIKYACIIAVLLAAALSGCANTDSEPVTAKLVSIIGGNFVASAGYYEGKLTLSDTKDGKEYSIPACSKNWDWVKEGSCYQFSPAEVNKNIDQHKYSAELSGCYIGILTQVEC